MFGALEEPLGRVILEGFYLPDVAPERIGALAPLDLRIVKRNPSGTSVRSLASNAEAVIHLGL